MVPHAGGPALTTTARPPSLTLRLAALPLHCRIAAMAGPLARLLARSEALRVVYTLLVFIPISFLALLASFTGRMALMVPLWHVFAWWMGVTVRVHGKAPPESTPSVWVANHFNWFDWPMLQVAARYKLYAVVKARRARRGRSAPAGADALALPGAKQAPTLRAWRRGSRRADVCHACNPYRRTSPWRTRWRACWRRGATTWAQSSIRAATARAARCVPARASRALAVVLRLRVPCG